MASSESLLIKLGKVQEALKVPKGQRNTFGNYNYRNAEDILEAVKPLLSELGLVLMLSDELVQVGERYYIKAEARLSDGERSLEVQGYAREEETKKGMDGSQITGASSSYARKYALNGLFLIDDTKDSDSTNDHGKAAKPAQAAYKPPASKPGLIDPALMAQLRTALRDANILGDAATLFVEATIGKPTPTYDGEVTRILDALKELNRN